MMEYVCKYAPVELLEGFGEECALCSPSAEQFAAADRLTHRNMCSFSRVLIESRAERGGGPLLLTDCCDSIRRAADVLRREGQDVFLLNLPRSGEECGRLLYKSELLKFIRSYSALTGKRFDCEKFREACGAAEAGAPGPRISLMGAKISAELLGFIREHSPLPVVNNTCTGNRRVGPPPPANDEDTLMEWYAGELLGQPSCMRMTDVSSRRKLTEDPDLRGIIYNTVKFCDFYGFEYASLRRGLAVPILKIETDYTLQSPAQLQNRLEAFFESLAWKQEEPWLRVRGPAEAKKRYAAGIDSGSTSTNAVILDGDRNLVSFSVVPTGVSVAQSARAALGDALKKAGLSADRISRTVSTGYGRASIGLGDRDVTEITCHARGAYFLDPRVRTVIDIGGQDSKVIRLDENGAVRDFSMNDKCAAGTGRFLEMMARSLGLGIEEIGAKGLEWKEEIRISSMCSVFAQSEVVSLIASGKRVGDIVHGLDNSVASRVLALCGRSGMKREYMMTGGVAKNEGVVRALKEKLGCPVLVPEEPEICGALGAALIALEQSGENGARKETVSLPLRQSINEQEI